MGARVNCVTSFSVTTEVVNVGLDSDDPVEVHVYMWSTQIVYIMYTHEKGCLAKYFFAHFPDNMLIILVSAIVLLFFVLIFDEIIHKSAKKYQNVWWERK